MKLGYNYCDFTDPDNPPRPPHKHIWRKCFCFYANFPIRSGLSVTGEIALHTGKGSEYDSAYIHSYVHGYYPDDYYIDAEHVKYEISYVQVPVLLRASFPRFEAAEPYFIIGPAIAFKRSSGVKYRWLSHDWEEDFDNANGVEISLIIGTGFAVRPRWGEILLEVRYDQGLSEVFTHDMEMYGGVRNTVVSVLFGFGVKYPFQW
jgi:hypothetical protein